MANKHPASKTQGEKLRDLEEAMAAVRMVRSANRQKQSQTLPVGRRGLVLDSKGVLRSARHR